MEDQRQRLAVIRTAETLYESSRAAYLEIRRQASRGTGPERARAREHIRSHAVPTWEECLQRSRAEQQIRERKYAETVCTARNVR